MAPWVGHPRTQHIDPHQPDERVTERFPDAYQRVDDPRVVDVLAARAGHRSSQDPPHQREADAGEHQRNDGGDDQVAAQVDAQTQTHHDPDAGRQALVHEADAEGVPHAQATDQAAGLSSKCYFTLSLCHVHPFESGAGAISGPPRTFAGRISVPTQTIAAPSSAGSAGTCQSQTSLSFHGTIFVRALVTPGIAPIVSFTRRTSSSGSRA